MKPPVFDHPVGHARFFNPGWAPPAHFVTPSGHIDPANYWQCEWCRVISRSWDAADTHTAEEHP